MKSIANWFLARLREPSTWAGIGIGAVAIQHLLQGNPSDLAAIIGGALAIVFPEKS